MDTLALEATQVAELADGGFSFDAGTDISVIGTSFLNASSGSAGLIGLLGAANVDVAFDAQGFSEVLGNVDGDAALDVLVNQLQDAGMDRLALDATQVADLADAGFSFDAGTDISVVGTSFLNASSGSAGLIGLLGAADVSVEMDAQGFDNLLADVRGDAALDGLVDQLHAAGMDTLVLDATQAVELAAADFSFELGTDITVVGTSFLHADNATAAQLHTLFDAANVTTSLGLSDIQSNYADLTELGSALYGLKDALDNSGIDQLAMTDDLTNALADALADADAGFISLMQSGTIGLDVLATSDVSDGTAYLNASLQDLQAVGVDQVTADAGVERIEIALRDANETGLQYSLADLPQFNVPQDMVVSLSVDEDDLAALLNSLNGDLSDLADSGITEINYTGDPATDLTELADAILSTASALNINVSAHSPTEVQLLGLGAEPVDPLDPFHKA